MKNPKSYLSFEDIDSMENDLGTNAWDYRGGYYTYPKESSKAGTIDPDCRHLWVAETRVRKKKK